MSRMSRNRGAAAPAFLSVPQLIEERARDDPGYAIANSLWEIATAIRDASYRQEKAIDEVIVALYDMADAIREHGEPAQ